ncbi:MAG: hypothetical protein J6D08_06600 [Lachnospiraceae bacterium]|nr:hypothetical protein [Lachnospiraceae bacterium]
MEEYICRKCRTGVVLKGNKKLKSLFCENCMKKGELVMLRRIVSNAENHKK